MDRNPIEMTRLLPVPCSCIKKEGRKAQGARNNCEFDLLIVRQLRYEGIKDSEYLKTPLTMMRRPKQFQAIVDGKAICESLGKDVQGQCWHLIYWRCRYRQDLLGLLNCQCTHRQRRLVQGDIFAENHQQLQGTWDKGGYIQRLNKFDLLVIDDFGTERGTEYGQEQVYNVIDNRMLSGKPIIVTSNLSIRDLSEPTDLASNRIYSRLLKMTPIRIYCNGENKRAKATKKQKMLTKA